MDQNQRWEQLARMNEAAPPPALRVTPKFGRAALAVSVGALVLFVLTASNGFPTRATADIARQIIMISGPVLSISLAVTSFVRKERRAAAVTAICILVAAPLLVFLVVILAWSGYARSMGG